MTSRLSIRVGAGIVAAGLCLWGATLPLWTLTMRAPQYPKGLRLQAHGTRMSGDISELNILNHYIGMPPIEAPATETALFPFAIAVLMALCLASPFHRWLRWLAIAAASAAPIAILADLQWRLYEFGHTLNPKAPIRLEPFTPLVLGQTTMGNFLSTGMVASGFWCLIAAVTILCLPAIVARRRRRGTTAVRVAAAAALALALTPVSVPLARAADLQPRIAAAAAGSVVTVEPGVYRGPVVIRGPLTVIGRPGAVIDGGYAGSVVTIEGHGVTFAGFTVRHSGRQVTEEAAGIKVTGDRHVIERNRIEDVYFGIHLADGADVVVSDNVITPGERHGARPGHGISAWHLRRSEIARNRISHARDGIYLSFTDQVSVTDNDISDCRYGLHSMYSHAASFEDNQTRTNLLGAALMMSDRLVLRRNRIVRHREGAAAYGILLKDIGDLTAEENVVLSNRIGIYAEGVPTDPSRLAVFSRNVIAGNEVGLALQSTAALTFTENRISENLTDVRPLGRQLSAGMRWSSNRRGNWWGQYRGYDADRDGIGDLPYRLEDAMDALIRRNNSVQAFLYTPSHLAVEAAARMFPVYRRAPVLIDEYPLMSPSTGGAK